MTRKLKDRNVKLVTLVEIERERELLELPPKLRCNIILAQFSNGFCVVREETSKIGETH